MKKLILALATALMIYATAALAAVNVNTASADELAGLPGIGQTKAEAIVDEREANGDYASLDELSRVSGIGEKTVEKLRSEATVGENTTEEESDASEE